jgi:serine/threonine-protein kinase RsbW
MVYPAQSEMHIKERAGAFFVIASTPLSVREALGHILRHPVMLPLNPEARGSAELVLAEALNNIVEHAYSCDDGRIDVQLSVQNDRLFCEVIDAGVAMPNNVLPAGLAQPIGEDQDLPEGGYGWFLIRSLTQNLSYQRKDTRNHLSFQLNIEQ